MTELIDVRRAPLHEPAAPPTLARGACWLILRLSTDNPFYVLSALLVLVGLWRSFGAQVRPEQTWALMFGLAGYTVLLAVPACLLVRFGGVWEDVRTVLLVVVLMFLATSVTFDETLARDPSFGTGCALLGLVFALFLSEAVLHALRLRLPAGFKWPYQLALALFYLYPVALIPLLKRPHGAALEWALYGFAPAAGLVTLTLLPAVRRGAGYVRDNGSPWAWPFYPWALFVFLGFGALGRSFLLCWSMQHVERHDPERLIFGPYFLAPLLLAAGLIVLEAGRTAWSRRVMRAGLAMPWLAVIASGVGHRFDDPLYREFFDEFCGQLGVTPLYAAVVAAAAFHGYAVARRVPHSTRWLVGTVLASSLVGTSTRDLSTLVAPQAISLLATAVLLFSLGIERRWPAARAAGLFALAAAALAMPAPEGVRVGLTFHILAVGGLILGAIDDDELARVLRGGGLMLLLLGSLVVSAGGLELRFGPVAGRLASLYPLAVAAGLVAYGFTLGRRAPHACAALAALGWTIAASYHAYSALREHVMGLDAIALGLVLLAIAEAISLAKAGLIPRRFSEMLARKAGPLTDGLE